MSALREGDPVVVVGGVHPFFVGLVGRVLSVDAKCDGLEPCPCCGRGVTVTFGVLPGNAYPTSPRNLLKLAREPAKVRGTRATFGVDAFAIAKR